MKKPQVVLTRMTEAKSAGEYLPLSSLTLMPELFRWREDEEIGESQLKGLYDSLIVNGQEEPVEYADLNGKNVVVKGHRRIAAFGLMIDKQVEGVTPDFPVLVKKVENATLLDLVTRSLNDNINRASLSEFGKVKGALKLRELGARDERVQASLNLSDTTLARYYRLGDHKWMWQHVLDGNLRLTDAHVLLEAAVNTNRVAELQRDLTVQFERAKARITALEAQRLEDKNESLSDSERLVKNHIEPHEMETWVAAVKQGKSFGPDSRWVYKAAIEEKNGQFLLKIPALSLKLVVAEIVRVRTTKERLEKVLRGLKAHLKRLEAEVEIARTHEAERIAEAAAAEAERIAEAAAASAPQFAESTPALTSSPSSSAGADPAFGRTEPRQLTNPLADVVIPDAPSSGSEEAKS